MSSDCLFCKIVAKEIPAKIVHEDDDVLAFEDINPQAPTHLLVIPKVHHATLPAASGDAELLGKVMVVAATVAENAGLSETEGFRTVINTGERAAQSVFHLHVHVLGGRMLGWPPG